MTHSSPSSVPPQEGAPVSPGAPVPAMTAAEIEAVRAREPGALGRFYERYVDRVFGLVMRLLGDRALAEDVTQEVFLRIHRAAHTLDPARDPGPWVLTVAHNLCRDVWRSGAHRMARRSASVDDGAGIAETLVSPGDDPALELVRREREVRVREALLELPETLRTAIVLHDYEGLGHEQIARRTGIEHAAARKRYSRALAALARRLEGRV